MFSERIEMKKIINKFTRRIKEKAFYEGVYYALENTYLKVDRIDDAPLVKTPISDYFITGVDGIGGYKFSCQTKVNIELDKTLEKLWVKGRC